MKDYYSSNGISAVDVIRAFNLNFFLGNVVKYVCRCGKKPNTSAIDDLEKAKEYIQFEIDHLNNEFKNKQADNLKGLARREFMG